MSLSTGKEAQVLSNTARATHTWVIGQPGSGKSKFLEALALQDILAGRGVGVLDPHGDLFRNLTHHLAAALSQRPELAERVVILDPCQPTWTVSFNPLETAPGVSTERLALFLTDVVVKVWKLDPANAPRMVWLLSNTFLALAELGLTLLDLPRFLTDSPWRASLLPRLAHAGVRAFFQSEFPRSEGAIQQWVTPVLNKLGSLLWDPDIRLMLGRGSTLTFRQVLDRKLVLLVHLPKGVIGEGASALLGAFIVAQLQKAALARADTREREPFYLYLDEFQNYTTDNIQDILSESRKYGLSVLLAHQYLDQLSQNLRSAVLNTTGTLICFRVGYHDAYPLAKEIFPSAEFLSSVTQEMKLSVRGRWPRLQVKEHRETLGWEGLAELLANLPPREFWIRRRGPYLPVQQRTLTLPDAALTPELEERLAQLLNTSGRRYGKPKREARAQIGEGRRGEEEPAAQRPTGSVPHDTMRQDAKPTAIPDDDADDILRTQKE